MTSRIVDPIRVVLVGGHSYLEAWSREAEGVRLFRFDRIVDATELDEPAAPPRTGAAGAAGHVTVRRRSVTAVGDAAGGALGVVDVRVLPDAGASASCPTDRAKPSMTYASDDWMTRLVLGFGSAVQVLEPESLAQRVRDAAAAALRVLPGLQRERRQRDAAARAHRHDARLR